MSNQLPEQLIKNNSKFNPIFAGLLIFFIGLAPLGFYTAIKMQHANTNSFDYGNGMKTGGEFTPLVRQVTGASFSFAPIFVLILVVFANNQMNKGNIDGAKGITSVLLGLTFVFITSLFYFYNKPEFNISLQAGEMVAMFLLPGLFCFLFGAYVLGTQAKENTWGKVGLVLCRLIFIAIAYQIIIINLDYYGFIK